MTTIKNIFFFPTLHIGYVSKRQHKFYKAYTQELLPSITNIIILKQMQHSKTLES